MNCMLVAYSKATGVSIPTLIHLLGHDGEEVVRPDFPEPFNKRSFYTSQFHDALYSRGFRFTELITDHVDVSRYLNENYNYIAYNTRHCESYYYTNKPCTLENLKGIILVDW